MRLKQRVGFICPRAMLEKRIARFCYSRSVSTASYSRALTSTGWLAFCVRAWHQETHSRNITNTLLIEERTHYEHPTHHPPPAYFQTGEGDKWRKGGNVCSPRLPAVVPRRAPLSPASTGRPGVFSLSLALGATHQMT